MTDPKTAAEVQARADSAFGLHNATAPPINAGETLGAFRRRILTALQGFSGDSALGAINFATMADDALPAFERTLINRTVEAAMKSEGPLRMITSVDDSGRKIRRFFGNPEACWGPFKAQPRLMRFRPGAGRGAEAPGAIVPVGEVMSDGSVRPLR